MKQLKRYCNLHWSGITAEGGRFWPERASTKIERYKGSSAYMCVCAIYRCSEVYIYAKYKAGNKGAL